MSERNHDSPEWLDILEAQNQTASPDESGVFSADPFYEPEENVVEESPAARVQQNPRPSRRVRQRQIDPGFAYIVLMALSVGLLPIATNAAIERYTVLWTLLALVGLGGAFFNNRAYVGQVKTIDLFWGGAFGLVVGLPLLLVGIDLLADISGQIFVGLPDGAVFQSIVFVMAPIEAFFFRGMLQASRTLMTTAMMSAAWSILMFLPALNVSRYLPVALVVSTFFVMLSIFYGYVRQRNGVAAAWLCQMVVSLLWLFSPRLLVM